MRVVWVQLAVAFAAVLGGAWLIGLWAVGVVLVLAGVGVGADVLLRERDRWDVKQLADTHAEVLERWRRSR